MNRFVILAVTLALCGASLLSGTLRAAAIPPLDAPQPWEYQAIATLRADGAFPREGRGARPATRRQMAELIARELSRMQRSPQHAVSDEDRSTLQRLMDAYRDQLDVLGVRERSVDEAVKPRDTGTTAQPLHTFHLDGSVLVNLSARQRTQTAKTIAGGPVDPFVNVFLTSPDDNNPFEHDLGPGDRLRLDNRITLNYAASSDASVSLPIRVISVGGAFTDYKYDVQPAVVFDFDHAGPFRRFYVRGGLLDNLQSSGTGLAFRAPSERQQGPGFQNPVQPYENGIEVGGQYRHLTHFQFSFGQLDQSMVNTFPNLGDQGSDLTLDNYFLTVNPPANSQIQFGAPSSSAGATRTDSFVASAGPIASIFLSNKAAPGTVYISAVNGVVCFPNGSGCPIGPNQWYYIDQTNQVVFQSPLPVGSTVQVSYAGLGHESNATLASHNYQYQRYHFNARIEEKFRGLPGAAAGFSLSRVFDAGDLQSQGLDFGNGYGAVSDTVYGLDGRVPLCFFGKQRERSSESGEDDGRMPKLFGEAAWSKYTPDFRNLPAITDSALVLGTNFRVATAKATVKYQAVGPDFIDGGPLRYLGPGPATFSFWRGTYFPQFYGFANNVDINQIFDRTVTPTCGTACTASNPGLTYIYPVFNPFFASGPQYFSAFAPNSRGFTYEVGVPLSHGQTPIDLSLKAQHLWETVPNGFGQLAYGPGFASDQRLKFDKFEAGIGARVPLLQRQASIKLSGSFEHLLRDDRTAYAYVPFNPATGGPDAASGAALNAYLATGATPVLFHPNFVDEFHSSFRIQASLPLTHDLSFGVGYEPQTYHGSYGTTISQNISEHKDSLVAMFNYNLPRSTNSIVALFGNQKYVDDTLPSFNFNQNREAINLITRF